MKRTLFSLIALCMTIACYSQTLAKIQDGDKWGIKEKSTGKVLAEPIFAEVSTYAHAYYATAETKGGPRKLYKQGVEKPLYENLAETLYFKYWPKFPFFDLQKASGQTAFVLLPEKGIEIKIPAGSEVKMSSLGILIVKNKSGYSAFNYDGKKILETSDEIAGVLRQEGYLITKKAKGGGDVYDQNGKKVRTAAAFDLANIRD